MNESRVFMLNGTDVQKIVTRLEGFFRTEKGMEVQSSETTEGYVMQASQPKEINRTLQRQRAARIPQVRKRAITAILHFGLPYCLSAAQVYLEQQFTVKEKS